MLSDTITALLFVSGIALLILGAEALVRGASGLAVSLGIPPLVVGLTVVAFGTSAPELAVSLQASLAGQADVAIGNVVGSNIANILLILGLAALVASPLRVNTTIIWLDTPIMIGASALLLYLSMDGLLSQRDGLIFLALIVAYTLFRLLRGRSGDVKRQAAQPLLERPAVTQRKQRERGWRLVRDLLFVGLGLVMLILGARWIVDGAVALSVYLGVSQLLVSLTIVAVGTSLPELATTVVAGLRGERDIAVGNLIGSNIFNILGVLGVASVANAQGVAVSPAALQLDIPVMLAVAVACLPVFLYRRAVVRWEGLLLVGYYAIYTTYLALVALRDPMAPLVSFAALYILYPLTGLIALALLVGAVRRRRAPRRVLLTP